MSTSSAERAARRIAIWAVEGYDKRTKTWGLFETQAYRTKRDALAAIEGCNAEFRVTKYIKARSSGEPKGEGKQ